MNMLTEDEAKAKWCPFVRIDAYPRGLGVGAAPAVNRAHEMNGDFTTVEPKCRCIGSACMAWRREPPVIVPADSVTPEMLAREPRGYCGLAGAAP
jgi:hypothetical protein